MVQIVDINKLKASLHEYERILLLTLIDTGKVSEEELGSKTKLPLASVSHASLWLYSKELVKITEDKKEYVELNKEGLKYKEKGLPERRALDLMKKDKTIKLQDLEDELGKEMSKIAISWLMRKKFSVITNAIVNLTEEGEEALYNKTAEELALEELNGRMLVTELSKENVKALEGRGKILKRTEDVTRNVELTKFGERVVKSGISTEKEVNTLTPQLIKSKKWKDVKFRTYDINAPVPKQYFGKRHFVKQATEYVRKIWLEMGFQEMNGPIIDTSFWNFDALFVPQEHPAREMQDTFFVEPEKGSLPHNKLVDAIKEVHEMGTRDSLGWNYEWSEEVAKKHVLRTHTTVLSAKTLAALKKEDWPAKFFALGRCFRNEAVDWKHLFEFNQVEGIVVDENANFKHLLGYLKQFYTKMGYTDIRVRPAFFPYTEMSLEVDVFHPGKQSWIELGGAGIFRPEVVEPLLGEEVPVLAWGQGFGRIISEYYKITDIRDLYKNDIKQIRESRQFMW